MLPTLSILACDGSALCASENSPKETVERVSREGETQRESVPETRRSCEKKRENVEAAAGDEVRELAVEKGDGDAEELGHSLERDGLVGVEELRVDEHAQLAHQKARVRREVAVLQEVLVEREDRFEELRVLACRWTTVLSDLEKSRGELCNNRE